MKFVNYEVGATHASLLLHKKRKKFNNALQSNVELLNFIWGVVNI